MSDVPLYAGTPREVMLQKYRGTLLINKCPSPPRTPQGPYEQAHGRVLGGCVFLSAKYPCASLKRRQPHLRAGPCLGPYGGPKGEGQASLRMLSTVGEGALEARSTRV